MFKVTSSLLILYTLIGFSLAQDSISTLKITSLPTGAQIYLDEILSGSTPYILNRIPVGKHTLKIARDGYEDWITDLNIEPIDTNSVHAILNPLRGQIQFNSDILNAYIYIDGKLVGRTPKLVREIEYGWHYIEIRRTKKENNNTDYNAFLDTIAVYNTNVLLINANLKKNININNLDPVAVYLFNGNANDESCHGNNGIVHGATLIEDRYGNPNKAYSLDGINDYIDVGNSSSLKPAFPISVSAWVKPKSYDEPIGIFRNSIHDSRYYGIFCQININGKAACGYGNGGGIGPYSRRSKHGEMILDLDVWYHVVYIFKSESEFHIYINGKKDGDSEPYSGTATYMNYNENPGEIGTIDSRSHNPPYFAKAIIDNIYLFDRVLNEDEILALYNDNN